MGARSLRVNVARPSDGFRIILSPAVEAHAQALLKDDPDFAWRWKSTLLRLAYTAHREGAPVGPKIHERIGVFEFPGLRILLAWRVLGDTVTIVRGDF